MHLYQWELCVSECDPHIPVTLVCVQKAAHFGWSTGECAVVY